MDDGLDAALRAVTLNRIVRILAAFLLAQAGGLLIAANGAWGALLGMQTVPAELWEGTAAAAGYLLVAAAVVLSLISRDRLRPEERAGRTARTGGTCAMTAGISVDLRFPHSPV